MSEFRRILMSSFLMLLVHFAAADGYSPIVRAGDEVTLPFDNVIHDQDKCKSTRWFFMDSRRLVTLFENGQIHKDLAKAKSDRLSVTENCSLVIKKVTEEDAGIYACGQFRSGAPDSEIDLSVVTMTEHQDDDEVTLRCSVSTYRRCTHSVKWLLQGRDVDEDHRDMNTSQSSCSASVTFLTSHFNNTSRSKLFTCKVTDDYTREVHLFPFSLQSSGEDTKPTTTTTAKNNINSAAERKLYYPIVRAGDEVTLPFDNVIDDQDKCESTRWYFMDSRRLVTLFESGQIHNDAKAKSDRLRATENCSLVIKKVTEEDVGFYVCGQFRSGAPDSAFFLSVVTMTEHQDTDEVTLRCSVKRRGECDHSVKWLLQGRDVDKDHGEIKTSQSSCSASVTFLTSHFSYTPRSELFTCEVTDESTGDVHLFPFSPQSSGEDTKPTTTTTAKNNINSGRLRLIIVCVGLAALLIAVVTVNIWTRAKGSKAQTEENMEQIDEDEDEADYENDGWGSASV